jgi:hypothetical protein
LCNTHNKYAFFAFLNPFSCTFSCFCAIQSIIFFKIAVFFCAAP